MDANLSRFLLEAGVRTQIVNILEVEEVTFNYF